MFGNIDPKKIQSMMKQMGIDQENIEASRVIIEKSDEAGGGRIIIENPEIVKVKMQGKESFQISGDIKEEEQKEAEKEENDEEKLEEDIKTIIEQTGADKEIVAIELEKNNGDIAETIIALSNKGSHSKTKKR